MISIEGESCMEEKKSKEMKEVNSEVANFFVYNLHTGIEGISQNLSVIHLVACSQRNIGLFSSSPTYKPMTAMIQYFQWYGQDKILDNSFDTVQFVLFDLH